MLAAKTALPVIGVPDPDPAPRWPRLAAVDRPDAARRARSRPSAIGNATNAGLLAAAILALGDPALAERLAAWRARQTEAVLADPSNAPTG